MTIIEKIVEIEANRRLSMELEIPSEFPIRQATLRLALTPAQCPEEISQTLSLQEAVASAGGAVALVRQWRDEWPCLEDGLIKSELAETSDINFGLLPSSEELQAMRRIAKLEYPGKPFRL